jgi:hypothetical protein
MSSVGHVQARFRLSTAAGVTSQEITYDLGNNYDTDYHLVGTWDGTTMYLYVNGLLKTTASFSGALDYTNWASTGFGFWIGRERGGSSQFRSGMVQKLRVFNAAITTSQAQSLFTADTIPSGLVLKYDIQEGSGLTLFDTSGNANDITAVKSGWVISGLSYAVSFRRTLLATDCFSGQYSQDSWQTVTR